LIKELDEHQIPVVLYDSGAPRENTLIIRTNYQHPLEVVFSYLCSLGHRRIACMGHHTMLGQMEKCMKVGLDAIPNRPHLHLRTIEVNDNPEDGRLAARALLDADSSLTGFVCASDWLAMGALRGLRESGLRVPADVSVTGFDDVTLAQFCNPPLTSVHIPRDRIGQIISDFLISREQRFPREYFIDPEVVVRDSTGPNKFHLIQ
jgi:DNA-binding LacI/PurR family transcriptional regulator